MQHFSRREILALAAPIYLSAAPVHPRIILFSKPLHKLPPVEAAKVAQQIGVSGLDLTVRPDGHVKPVLVREDLPRVHEAVNNLGLDITMVNTEFVSIQETGATETLQTAGKLRIPHFKLGYWAYRDAPIEQTLATVKAAARGLVGAGSKSGIRALWHNHSGDNVGHAFWDAYGLVSQMDTQKLGFYFDLSHATSEGAVAGWRIALRLALPRLQGVVAKDHTWERKDGKWIRRTCPLGQGVVDFPQSFSILAKAGFRGFVTLDCPYNSRDVAESLADDFSYLKGQLAKAYGNL